MIEYIQQYYLSERNTALISLFLGIGLMIGMRILWKRSEAISLKRGLAYGLFGGGVFFFVTGCVYVSYCYYKLDKLSLLKDRAEQVLYIYEKDRITRVVESGYTEGLMTFSFLAVGGLVLLVTTKSQKLKGLALGLLLTGGAGLATELYSRKKNLDYKTELEGLKEFKN